MALKIEVDEADQLALIRDRLEILWAALLNEDHAADLAHAAANSLNHDHALLADIVIKISKRRMV